ncbi:uncharacterized protein LOC144437989 [Glandiceps talaboti]
MTIVDDTPDGPQSQTTVDEDDTDTKKIVEGFIQKTSGHCLPRIVRAKSVKSRCFWSALFFIAIVVFVYQAITLIKLYASYDLVAKINEGTTDNITFPAVTLCNTNKLRKSRIEKSIYSEILRTDPVHEESFHQALSYQDSKCLAGDFQCSRSKLCIKAHQRCDGRFHCLDDLSDEQNCDKSYILCEEGQFNCEVPGFYGYCIDKKKRCDGIQHCFDGKDEENCVECKGGLKCDVGKNGGKCISDEQKCDRYPDCNDMADEINCLDKYDQPCGKNLTIFPFRNSSFYSPRYPFPYENNESCIVELHSESEEFCIAISFLHVDMEWHPDCYNDYLEIRDLKNSNLKTTVCGFNIPDRWISSSNSVKLFYRTDSQFHSQGFHIVTEEVVCPSTYKKWKTSPWLECSLTCGGGINSRDVWCEADEDQLPEGERNKTCPGLKPSATKYCQRKTCEKEFEGYRDSCGQVFIDPHRVIKSRGHGKFYDNGSHCRYSIVNPHGGCINLTLREVELEDSKDCVNDYIKIEDMNEKSLTRLYCGTPGIVVWASYSGNVSVTFHSNIDINFSGYKLDYKFVPCGVWHFSPWSECNVTCGSGIRFRKVHCRSRGTWTIQPDNYCKEEKPSTQEVCTVPTQCPPRTALSTMPRTRCDGFERLTKDKRICEDFLDTYRKKNVYSRVPDSSSTINWQDFLSFSQSPVYTDLMNVLKLGKDEILRYGHNKNDFVLQCSFDDALCSSRDFSVFQNDVYGNCFTFNPDKADVMVRYADKKNARTGLKLTLNIEQDEYIPMYGQDAGVVVLVHPPDVVPFPENSGITVPPGKKASIAIRKDSYTMPGAPYSDCIDKKNFISIFGKGYNYSTEACHISTLNMYIQKECKCNDTVWMTGKPRCRVTNTDHEFCRQYVSYLYYRGILLNDCKQSCRQITYAKSVSLSQWPSNKHVKGLLKLLRPISDRVRNTIMDEQSVRDNLISLNIYYDYVNYRNTMNKPVYTIDQLVADLGGLFGLYLGISLITVVEFVEFVHDLYSYWISWNRIKKKKERKKKLFDSHFYDPVPSKSRSADFGTRV